jgi:DNA end-binding protein Ku
VCAADIDPVFYERAYYVGGGEKAQDAYRLLRDALERTGRAAVGRFTFHNREYVAVIRPFDGVLALHTLRFADEVVSGDEFDYDAPRKGAGEREVKMAGQLVESLHEKFLPARYTDEYREAVLDVVKRNLATMLSSWWTRVPASSSSSAPTSWDGTRQQEPLGVSALVK